MVHIRDNDSLRFFLNSLTLRCLKLSIIIGVGGGQEGGGPASRYLEEIALNL